MTPSVKQAIIRHAQQELPREACGLVVIRNGREVYHPCRNLSTNADQFVMDPLDYEGATQRGELVAVVHSHPYASPEPSQADKAACERSGVPWHIVSVPGFEWSTLTPSGWVAPLIGREFHHGVLDCYTLVRDWFALNCNAHLPDFERGDDWWVKGQNLYLERYALAGFHRVPLSDDKRPDELQVGDLLLMQLCSPVPNHAAIWLGDGTILHHLAGRLSSRDIFGGYYRKHSTHALRYARA